MIEAGRVTYPTIVDEPTQALIFDWFQYREVCDNDKFNNFFNRTLKASMRKYNQLLRIQPGETVDGVKVTYDWLIQEYHERQVSLSEDSSHVGWTADESSKTVGEENGGQIVTTDIRHDTTDKLTSRLAEEEGQDTTATVTEEQRDLVDSSAREDVSSSTSSQSDISSHTGSDSSDDKTLAKAAPQSISYSGVTGVPSNLDWTYPGSQQETKHTGSDSSDDDRAVSSVQDGSLVSTDTATHTGSTTGSGSSVTDKVNSKAESGAENTEFSGDGTTTVTDTSTKDITESGTARQDVDFWDEKDSNTREQSNGRTIDIATLLENAKNYILGSTAWNFLYHELDKLFISIYND